jgi:acyl-CoA synthetase (AMP-forming)/AMP-acid ligase II
MAGLEPTELVRVLDEERIGYAVLVPSMLQMCLTTVPDVTERSYPYLRMIHTGAAPIAKPTLRRTIEVFGCDVVVGYGMTEASGAVDDPDLGVGQRAAHAAKQLGTLGEPAAGVVRGHRAGHQRHVMMPSVPLAHLVLSHPQAVLGFSQNVFDPKARRLHRGELMERSIGLGVGERELDGVGTIDFAAHEEMPTPGVVFLAVPQPHARTEHLDGNEAFLSTTQHDASPSRSGLGLEPLDHRDGTGLRAKEARWSSGSVPV